MQEKLYYEGVNTENLQVTCCTFGPELEKYWSGKQQERLPVKVCMNWHHRYRYGWDLGVSVVEISKQGV